MIGLAGAIVAAAAIAVLTIVFQQRFHETYRSATCFFCGWAGYVRRDELAPSCPDCEAAL